MLIMSLSSNGINFAQDGRMKSIFIKSIFFYTNGQLAWRGFIKIFCTTIFLKFLCNFGPFYETGFPLCKNINTLRTILSLLLPFYKKINSLQLTPLTPICIQSTKQMITYIELAIKLTDC